MRTMNRSLHIPASLVLTFAAALAAFSCGDPPQPVAPKADPAAKRAADASAAFEVVRSVLQHPRCQNCHPGGDAPLQGDDGRVHAQNVMRGPEGRGMPGEECVTCHGPANPPDSYGLHIPPGVGTGWRMPPPGNKLEFVGLTSGELCARVTDPGRNGGKDAAALVTHLEDPLVAWGWTPGRGRTAIPVSRADLMNAWKTWAAAGSPCKP